MSTLYFAARANIQTSIWLKSGKYHTQPGLGPIASLGFNPMSAFLFTLPSAAACCRFGSEQLSLAVLVPSWWKFGWSTHIPFSRHMNLSYAFMNFTIMLFPALYSSIALARTSFFDMRRSSELSMLGWPDAVLDLVLWPRLTQNRLTICFGLLKFKFFPPFSSAIFFHLLA